MTRFIEEVTLDEELFSTLKHKFVELGTPMKEMWGLVMPETRDMLHGFGGKPETMTRLKKLLRSQITGPLAKSDRSWARNALDKAMNPRQTKLHLSSSAHPNRLTLPAEGSEEESSDDKPDDLHGREALCFSSRGFGLATLHGSHIDHPDGSCVGHPHPSASQPQAHSTVRARVVTRIMCGV